MKKKTLVCILSETRAFDLTWEKFKTHVIDELDADLALCISVPLNYDFSNPFWQFAKYKFTFKEYLDWGLAYDFALAKLQSTTQQNIRTSSWRKLLDIKDQWLGGVKGDGEHPGSAGILIFARWYLLQSIIDQGLLAEYEHFIITRSDFMWCVPHPSPVLHLNGKYIWVPDGEGHGGITDRHVVLSRENIVAYLSPLTLLLSKPDLLYGNMCHYDHWNLERFLLFYLTHCGLADKIRLFPYCMYSVRSWAGSTSWSKGTWSDKHGYYIKYDTEYQSASAASEIVHLQSDWQYIFNDKSADRGFDSLVTDLRGNLLELKNSKIVVCTEKEYDPRSIYLTIDFRLRSGALHASSRKDNIFFRKRLCGVTIRPSADSAFNMLLTDNDAFLAIVSGELRAVGSIDGDLSNGFFRILSRYSAGISP